MKAIWNNRIIAQSNQTVVVEGNHYFPPDSVNMDFLQSSELHTSCPWKGSASYYDVVVEGKTNPGSAWYYPEPFAAAKKIKNHIAFWKGVKVKKD